MIRLLDVIAEADSEHVRLLFRAYAAEFVDLLSSSLERQGFEDEVAGLPGKYAPPEGALVLATHDGEPAGCVALRPLGEGLCEMKRLYVPHAYRGQGVGKMLVEAILVRAREMGYERMRLDTVPGLVDALRLYRRFGFVEIPPYSEQAAPGTIFLEASLRTDAYT